MQQYLDAVREVIVNGTRKENRTGVDTISTFNINYEIDMSKGFPLLTTKKINWKNIVIENLWFLSGSPYINLLHKHNCKFWDSWVDEHERVPSAYGNFWSNFPVHDAEAAAYTRFHPYPLPMSDPLLCVGWNNQIEWAINELKHNPMSRRVVITAWAPGNAQTSKLPPCHIVWVLNVQNMSPKCNNCGGSGIYSEYTVCNKCKGLGILSDDLEPRLCLHLTQRSCDMALGVPYNIAGYALILELMSRFVGIRPGIFAHTLVDAHVYTNKPDGSMSEYDHVPGLLEQLKREPKQLPRLMIDSSIKNLDDLFSVIYHLDTDDVMSKFVLEGYNPYPAIRFKVAV